MTNLELIVDNKEKTPPPTNQLPERINPYVRSTAAACIGGMFIGNYIGIMDGLATRFLSTMNPENPLAFNHVYLMTGFLAALNAITYFQNKTTSYEGIPKTEIKYEKCGRNMKQFMLATMLTGYVSSFTLAYNLIQPLTK